jgi:hypothetical protein
MTEDIEVTTPAVPEVKKIEVKHAGGASDSVYAMGLIGAWVYYIGRAGTFKEGVAGFFKAFAWPALLVYKALKLLDTE